MTRTDASSCSEVASLRCIPRTSFRWKTPTLPVTDARVHRHVRDACTPNQKATTPIASERRSTLSYGVVVVHDLRMCAMYAQTPSDDKRLVVEKVLSTMSTCRHDCSWMPHSVSYAWASPPVFDCVVPTGDGAMKRRSAPTPNDIRVDGARFDRRSTTRPGPRECVGSTEQRSFEAAGPSSARPRDPCHALKSR